MAKAYLAHSSKQKQFVEQVALKLRPITCIFDKFNFESGLRTIDEIMRGIDASDVFVLFLSDKALDSDWVKKEIVEAYDKLERNTLKRIFPIIVDDVTYDDPRIPEWMRNEYNLKYVAKANIAAQRISQQLREISWDLHPKLMERSSIFVGRNDLINIYEERLDNFDLIPPTCLIASGIPSTGRRTLMRKCLTKSNLVKESYRPPIITLNGKESIEDFILKVNNLGFTKEIDVMNLFTMTVEQKIQIALQLATDFFNAKEILFIVDNSCIVTHESNLTDWFYKIIERLVDKKHLLFIVVSNHRVNRSAILHKDFIFALDVPELGNIERQGLFKRFLELEEIELSKENFLYFYQLFSGFPEQIMFAVDIIKNEGLAKAKELTNLIVEFNSERIIRLVQKFESNQTAFDFLHLLSEFDFISYEFTFQIVGADEIYKKLLSEFSGLSMIETIGATKEYFRINDTIRDYVRRQKLKINETFEERLRIFAKDYMRNYSNDSADLSQFMFSIREALISGEDVPESLLIPSHFLNTMVELYDRKRRFSEVISLADRVLEKSQYLDKNIELMIRYWLCLSLARIRNNRFLKEVQEIKGSDHNFLMGFFYRRMGRYDLAIEKLTAALNSRPNFYQAKRELLQVYLNMDDYENAYKLARGNYEFDKKNPFHIQGYLKCLIRDRSSDHSKEIEELLQDISIVMSDRAKEMFLCSKAQYYFYYKNDTAQAISTIDEAINDFPDSIYPKLNKLDFCERLKDGEEMANILNLMDKNKKQYTSYQGMINSFKAKLMALRGDVDNAIEFAQHNLNHFYPVSSIQKLIEKLKSYK
jgi:tetratricopeptide (TPR) repeat protein